MPVSRYPRARKDRGRFGTCLDGLRIDPDLDQLIETDVLEQTGVSVMRLI